MGQIRKSRFRRAPIVSCRTNWPSRCRTRGSNTSIPVRHFRSGGAPRTCPPAQPPCVADQEMPHEEIKEGTHVGVDSTVPLERIALLRLVRAQDATPVRLDSGLRPLLGVFLYNVSGPFFDSIDHVDLVGNCLPSPCFAV
jgi:hypothetical protein